MKPLREQWIFHKNDIPLVRLISIRSDLSTPLPEKVADFKNDPIFLHLPTFPTKNIKEFYYSLVDGHGLQKSLETLGFKMIFNFEFIDSLTTNFIEKRKLLPDVYVFSFLYYALAFIYYFPSIEKSLLNNESTFSGKCENNNYKKMTVTETPEGFEKIGGFQPSLNIENDEKENSEKKGKDTIISYILKFLNIVNNCATSNFSIYVCDIFKELMKVILEKDEIIEWNILLLNSILEQIVLNRSYDSQMSSILIQILTKITSLGNLSLVDPFLSIIVVLFEDHRPVVNFSNYSTVVSLISDFICDLNLNALIVLGYCSQREKSDTIKEVYQMLPNYILSHLNKHKVLFDPKELFPKFSVERRKSKGAINNLNIDKNSSQDNSEAICEIKLNSDKNEKDENEEIEFETPPENLIHCESKLIDFCVDYLQSYVSRFNSFFTLSSQEYTIQFINSLVCISRMVNRSNHSIDFTILIASLLRIFHLKQTVSLSIPFFLDSLVFNPDYSIFSHNEIDPTVSKIRNSIFNIISELDSTLFYQFIEGAASHPLLLAEHIMRLSYKFGNLFFSKTSILHSLLSSINLLQHTNNYLIGNVYYAHHKAARTVILSVVISLLENNAIAYQCFSDSNFCTSFMNLLLENSTTDIAIDIFVKCISQFPTLPESTTYFISFILQSCQDSINLHENNINNHNNTSNLIEKREENNQIMISENKHDTQVACSLIKAIISATSHNISLGVSVSSIFDNTLRFLKLCNDPETLGMTMSICALITTSQNSIEVNSERYNLILDIIYKIEQNEPSDSTLQSFLNQMNASTNTAIDQMFLIQSFDVIPLILVAFSKSERINTIIDLFQRLCLYSVKNIIQCHNGDLSLILLKSLIGPFSYKNRKIEFKITEDSIDSILKLISTIVSCRSSIIVNNSFLRLIFPNPETKEFLPISNKAVISLYQLFSHIDETAFQICTEAPVYTVNSVEGDRLYEGFAFSFLVKIDFPNIMQINGRFIFLQIKDSFNRILELYQQQESMIIRYESPTLKTSTTVAIPIPSNKCVCISAFIFREDNRTIVYFKLGNNISDDVLFKTVTFEKKVDVSIGFTSDVTIPPNELSPISMSNFALFLPPFDDVWFDTLASNGFVEMNRFPNISFSNYSPNTVIHTRAKRENMSISSLMPLHTKLLDFLDIFNHIEKQSPLFIELVIGCMFFFTNCLKSPMTGSSISIVPDHINEIGHLSNMTKIPESILTNLYKTYDHNFVIHMNEVSVFFSAIFNTEIRSEHYILSTCFKLIESATNTENQLEILETVILNLWFWFTCENKKSFNKNLRQLNNFLSQFAFDSLSKENDLFVEFLIQSHLLMNYSTEVIPDLNSYRFRILEAIPMNIHSIEVVVSIILYINDQNIQILQINNANNTDQNENMLNNFTEMINYLEFLGHMTLQLKLKFPKKLLIALTDISTYSSSAVVSSLISLLKIAAGDNLNHYLLCIALKTNNRESLDKIESDSFDMICIKAIKFESIEILLDYAKRSDVSLRNHEMWWFWIALTAAIMQREEIIVLIVSNLAYFDQSQFINMYLMFISIFSLLRATNAFPGIFNMFRCFISSVLEHVLINNTSFSKQAQFSIALLAFFACFYKLKENKPSKALLRIFNNVTLFKDSSNMYSGNQMHQFNPKNLTLQNLKMIFSIDFESYHFKYWLSHSKHYDMRSLTHLRVINSSLINDFEGIVSNKLICLFLDEMIHNHHINISLAEEIFPKIENSDKCLLINDLKKQTENCWASVKSLIYSSSHSFKYSDLFLSYCSFEMYRFSKICNAAKEASLYYQSKQTEMNQNISLSRFVRFPLYFSYYFNSSKTNQSNNHNNNFQIFLNNFNANIISNLMSNNINESNSQYKNSNKDKNIKRKTTSFRCQMITIKGPVLSTFILANKEFRILKVGQPIIRIPYHTIKFITTFRIGCIEVFVSAFQSFLLAMQQTDIEIILDQQKYFPFPVLKDSNEIVQSTLESYVNRRISVFDLILALNFASGRSFNDLSYFPMCPIFWEGKFRSSLSDIENRNYSKAVFSWYSFLFQYANQDSYQDPHQNQNNNQEGMIKIEDFLKNAPNCITPHLFTINCSFHNPFSDITEEKLLRNIYHNRKMLEKKPFKEQVTKWLQLQFNVTFPQMKSPIVNFEISNLLQKKDSNEISVLGKTKPVELCYFFDGFKDAFAMITSSHSMKIYGISSENDQIIKKAGKIEEKFDLTVNEFLFCVLRHAVVVINKTMCYAYRLSFGFKNSKISFSTYITDVCGINDLLVVVIDKHIIQIIDIENLPDDDSVEQKGNHFGGYFDSNSLIEGEFQTANNNIRFLAAEDCEIEFITSSIDFDVIVYQTSDYKITVVSVSDAQILSSISLTQKVSQILITEENGLLILKLENEIEVFTMNGKFLNKCEFHSKFANVTSCRSPKGVDFIFYIDERGDLGMFEAIDPSKRKIILSGLKNIVAMKVSRKKTCIFLISQIGEILSFPINFNILFELCI
ncbi:hypothetical protein TRFO_05834 [Tritrichomonas foetus]|uniref:BEACH domain-containing protein n=1 Tax=Tritrichomonas foetus TaxID=1144522 RepID=A0A1J4K3D3_9EUKA|nr:hypothetical protein TRFO_05834 [Tritrichomonas foetus]|eukprot:OHT05691.1 hypothetical protein TRFO_05834 [Tritrichomonas foetus]